MNLQAFDLSYFPDKSHFEEDGEQNNLVFQPMYKYFKKIGNIVHISAWNTKGLYDKSIKPCFLSEDCLAHSLSYIATKTRVKFIWSFLNKIKFHLLIKMLQIFTLLMK